MSRTIQFGIFLMLACLVLLSVIGLGLYARDRAGPPPFLKPGEVVEVHEDGKVYLFVVGNDPYPYKDSSRDANLSPGDRWTEGYLTTDPPDTPTRLVPRSILRSKAP